VKKQMELHREHYEVQARFQNDLQKLQGPTGPCQRPDALGPTGGGYMPPIVPGGAGGSFVPPPGPNGAYMPPPLQSSGSYVPPPMPNIMPDMVQVTGGGGGSYVPPVAAYTGSGSYVPPPGSGPAGCNGVMQPQLPSYGPAPTSMGNFPTAPPTNYGQLPSGCRREEMYTNMATSYPGPGTGVASGPH